MAERPLVARIRRILKKEEEAMQVSRKAVGLVLGTALAVAITIGGYYCLPSRAGDSSAEDSSAQAKGPDGETAHPVNSAVPGDVIEGVVVNERGKPQPGIDIWTENLRGRKSTTKSGADGRFRLEVPLLIGEFSLLASNADGTRQGMLTACKLGRGKFPAQQVVLKSGRMVEVQVIDASGNPVVAATVEAYVVGVGSTTCHVVLGRVVTDPRGKARWTVPADAKLGWIAAWKAGVGMDCVYVKALAKDHSPPGAKKLVLNGVTPVSVRVHDSAGRAIPGVEVTPSQLWKKGNRGRSPLPTPAVWAVSDAQGRVQFDFLPADLEKGVGFSIRSGDYYYPGANLPIKDGGSRNLDVELRAPAQISGKVTYPDGKAAAGIMIQADGMGMGIHRD